MFDLFFISPCSLYLCSQPCWTFGRCPTAAFCLEDVAVSRRHANLKYSPASNQWTITDLKVRLRSLKPMANSTLVPFPIIEHERRFCQRKPRPPPGGAPAGGRMPDQPRAASQRFQMDLDLPDGGGAGAAKTRPRARRGFFRPLRGPPWLQAGAGGAQGGGGPHERGVPVPGCGGKGAPGAAGQVQEQSQVDRHRRRG